MKKLKLEMDALRVQSFAAAPVERVRGTVRGHLPPTDPRVCPYSYNYPCTVAKDCSAGPTCYISCDHQCDTIETCAFC